MANSRGEDGRESLHIARTTRTRGRTTPGCGCGILPCSMLVIFTLSMALDVDAALMVKTNENSATLNDKQQQTGESGYHGKPTSLHEGTRGFINTGLTQQQPVNYSGHSVIRVWPQDDDHVDIMSQLYSNSFGQYDFWRAPSVVKRSVDIRVSPDDLTDLVSQLDSSRLLYKVSIKDLQSSIEAEKRSIPDSENGPEFNLTVYHTFDEISIWLDRLDARCGPLCETIVIGESFEGRPMKVIRIGTPDDDKPIVWVDAGIHAREWIAPATALHLIDKLLTGSSSDIQTRYLLSRYVWYVLPVANPDGYAYTWTSDRMWRKTRSVIEHSPCRGADPNRNWDFHWGGEGTSGDPCSENYRGSRPFSEPETQAMARFILGMRDRMSIYLTLHSYGQYWLTPWGFTYDVPGDYGELIVLGERATKAMTEHGASRQYRVGASSRMLYLAAGGSDDWAKGSAGVRYSYTVELADTGQHGFVLPARFIQPTGKQMFHAICTLALEVIKQGQSRQGQQREDTGTMGSRPRRRGGAVRVKNTGGGMRLSDQFKEMPPEAPEVTAASADGELDEMLTAAETEHAQTPIIYL